MKTLHTVVLIIAGLLLIGTSVQAQVTLDEAKQLEQRYKGVPLRVRDLLSDSKIRYDANGKLIGKWSQDNGRGTAMLKSRAWKQRKLY